MSLKNYDHKELDREIARSELFELPTMMIFLIGAISTMDKYKEMSPQEVWYSIVSSFIEP